MQHKRVMRMHVCACLMLQPCKRVSQVSFERGPDSLPKFSLSPIASVPNAEMYGMAASRTTLRAELSRSLYATRVLDQRSLKRNAVMFQSSLNAVLCLPVIGRR